MTYKPICISATELVCPSGPGAMKPVIVSLETPNSEDKTTPGKTIPSDTPEINGVINMADPSVNPSAPRYPTSDDGATTTPSTTEEVVTAPVKLFTVGPLPKGAVIIFTVVLSPEVILLLSLHNKICLLQISFNSINVLRI